MARSLADLNGVWAVAPLPGLPDAAAARALLERVAPAAARAAPVQARQVRRLRALLDELHACENGGRHGLSGDAPTRSGRWPEVAIHATLAAVERAPAPGLAYAVRLTPRAQEALKGATT